MQRHMIVKWKGMTNNDWARKAWSMSKAIIESGMEKNTPVKSINIYNKMKHLGSGYFLRNFFAVTIKASCFA